jgi:ElaB/YqjD/DUF883 family membrane-anchored ribosome-binding protein
MPTTKAAQAAEDMREEFDALRKDVSEIMALLKDKGSAYKDELSEQIEEKFEDYQARARQGAEEVYEKGSEGLEEVGSRIRQHPLASLAIAFGAGYIISKLMDQGK